MSDRQNALGRRLFLTGGLAVLSACGFTPLYGSGGEMAALRGRVALVTPRTEDGYDLRNRLAARLGDAADGDLVLEVDLSISESPVAIAPDNTATRINLPGQAMFSLRTREGTVQASGTVESFTSYSTTSTTVATRAAEDDARERLVAILAELVLTRIAAILSRIETGEAQ